MYYSGRQEGQFDLGLVNRWGNLQAGAFGSFKYLNFKDYQSGGGLGQAAFMIDYLFSRGRIGLFTTKGFKNYAVLNQVQLGPQTFMETYARVVDQTGVNALVGAWGNAYLEGNLGYLRRHNGGNDRPGGSIKLVQPLNEHVAFTAEAGLERDAAQHEGQRPRGVRLPGRQFHPSQGIRAAKTPVPMDVPRVRYELLTRRVGNTAPVANAGPDQTGVAGRHGHAGWLGLLRSGRRRRSPTSGRRLPARRVTLSAPTAAKTDIHRGGRTDLRLPPDGHRFRRPVRIGHHPRLDAPTRNRRRSFASTPRRPNHGGPESTLTWIVQGASRSRSTTAWAPSRPPVPPGVARPPPPLTP